MKTGSRYIIIGLVWSILICTGRASPRYQRATLQPGDIIYTDSGTAHEGGVIVKVDRKTGEQTVISSGKHLVQPFCVALDAKGNILVADGALVRVDPNSGEQSIVMDNSEGTLGLPFGIALDRSGEIVVANGQSLLCVSSANGRCRIVSSGQRFLYPLGVAFHDRGDLIVLNMAFPPEILRVNAQTGIQTVVTQGGYLNGPQAIAIDGDNIYVTDVADPERNFGVGRLIHISARTGSQTVVAEGGFLVRPVGIAVDESGQLIIADPYTINLNSRDLFDGGIVQINPLTGDQTLLASGYGSFLNPCGVAIVPGLTSATKRAAK